MTTEPKIEEEFAQELQKLRELAASSINSCLVAQLIALTDAKASALFLEKLKKGYLYKGSFCPSVLEIPEQKSVVFNFDCPPARFSLINPSFLVVVDLAEKRVIRIEDPYIPFGRATFVQSTGQELILPSTSSFHLLLPSHQTRRMYSLLRKQWLPIKREITTMFLPNRLLHQRMLSRRVKDKRPMTKARALASITLTLTLCVHTATSQAVEKTATNEKFGFSVNYPFECLVGKALQPDLHPTLDELQKGGKLPSWSYDKAIFEQGKEPKNWNALVLKCSSLDPALLPIYVSAHVKKPQTFEQFSKSLSKSFEVVAKALEVVVKAIRPPKLDTARKIVMAEGTQGYEFIYSTMGVVKTRLIVVFAQGRQFTLNNTQLLKQYSTFEKLFDEIVKSFRILPIVQPPPDISEAEVGIDSAKEAIIQDLNNLAAHAYQYRIRPKSMQGGGGSYSGYKIPMIWSKTENATYLAIPSADYVYFTATSPKNYGTIRVKLTEKGKLVDWLYSGDLEEK